MVSRVYDLQRVDFCSANLSSSVRTVVQALSLPIFGYLRNFVSGDQYMHLPNSPVSMFLAPVNSHLQKRSCAALGVLIWRTAMHVQPSGPRRATGPPVGGGGGGVGNQQSKHACPDCSSLL